MLKVSKHSLQFFLYTLTLVLFLPLESKSQGKEKKVLILEIRDEIAPGMSRYVELGLNHAKDINADYIIVNMDTYGGMVDAADKIRTAFLQFPKPIFVFINDNAASAGALISIACDSIYMTKGASIGASTVVDQDGKAVSDKYQSYMKAKMKATAEASGRNPEIAVAMVGVNISGDSTYKEGKVLTLSTSEAIKVGYCDGQVSSIDEILKLNNIVGYTIETYELDSVSKIESFFLSPYLRSILILLILAGIYFEMQSPGIGFPILVSITAAALYFIPSYLQGFAESWEILLFFIGIALIIVEIFLIPGFGFVGIGGVVLAFAGLVLVMLSNDFLDFSDVSTGALTEALGVLMVGIAGGAFLLIVGGRQMMKSKAFKRITLQESMQTTDGYTSSFFKEPMVGKTGIAYTVLRPSGKIMIDDIIYDAYSRNNFIEQGTEVEVIEEYTTSLKVKKKE